MKPRLCWSVLESKAQQQVALIQADIVRARQLLETLNASSLRLQILYDEYRAQDLAGVKLSQGMQDAMNHRQFMTQLLALLQRVEQDITKAELALKGLHQRMAKAEGERLKMKALDEQEQLAFAAQASKREQRSMDELGVMQFNLPKR